MWSILLAMISLSVGSCADAGHLPPEIGSQLPIQHRGIVTSPTVASLPTPQALLAFHPRTNGGPETAGYADLDCLALVNQHVTDCRVISESPADQGFGAAALSVTRLVLIFPGADDGVPTERRIRFRLAFPASD